MRTLTIKGLPDPIYETLKRQAKANRRSLNSEIIVCLERAAEEEPFDSEAMLAELDAFRKRTGFTTTMTDDEMRAVRREGLA